MNHPNLAPFLSATLLLCVASTGALGQEQPSLHPPLHPRYLALPPRGVNVATIRSQAAAATTIPIWTSSNLYQGTTYTQYQMVGQDPSAVLTNPVTVVKTPIVPVIFTFADGTIFDPTTTDTVCSPAGSATGLTLASPVFKNAPHIAGGTDVGTIQYADFFQRADFWQYTNPAGANPNYHVLLSAVPLPAISVIVPPDNGQTMGAFCGSVGQLDLNWWDSYLQTTIFSELSGSGVDPTTFPIFLFYNVVLYQYSNPADCCVFGYHTSFLNPAFNYYLQTYAIADYDASGGSFTGVADVAPLSHEVGEWMADPTGTNLTPYWGNVGQVQGCQSNLEVGDPLTGTTVQITMPNNFTYHPQELVFLSWVLSPYTVHGSQRLVFI